MSAKKIKEAVRPAAAAGKWAVARPMGLARILQKAGYGTREEAAEMVTRGRATVDGEVVTDPAFTVNPGSSIELDSQVLQSVQPTYFLFHKPARVVCASADGPDRRRVADFLPPDVPGLSTVGRMDSKTTGLLLVSNDSGWNNVLTSSKTLEQEYRIQVEGELTELEISVITAGIHMPNLGIFKPASVRIVEKLNHRTVILMVTKGTKARMVRRMFSTLRHEIKLLRRIRVGELRLGNLPPGGLRRLDAQEISEVLKLAQAPPPPASES